jgi:hypothetical protein
MKVTMDHIASVLKHAPVMTRQAALTVVAIILARVEFDCVALLSMSLLGNSHKAPTLCWALHVRLRRMLIPREVSTAYACMCA